MVLKGRLEMVKHWGVCGLLEGLWSVSASGDGMRASLDKAVLAS